MRKRIISIILYLCLASGVVTGCGNKEKVPDDGIENEPVIKSQSKAVKKLESEVSTEEPEHLQEYIEALNSLVYKNLNVDDDWLEYYKCCYYADDMNGDGYPELFVILSQDITASVQELYLRIYSLQIHKEGQTSVYNAVCRLEDAARTDALEEPSGGIEWSYTSDGKNILMRTYTIGVPSLMQGPSYKTSFKEELFVYKDLNFLENGSRESYVKVMADGSDYAYYMTIDAGGNYYYEEADYENFDIGSYDKTLIFTEDCGWEDIGKAIENLGKFSE